MSNRNYFTEPEIDTLIKCVCPYPYEAGEPYACACGITWTWAMGDGCWTATDVPTTTSKALDELSRLSEGLPLT